MTTPSAGSSPQATRRASNAAPAAGGHGVATAASSAGASASASTSATTSTCAGSSADDDPGSPASEPPAHPSQTPNPSHGHASRLGQGNGLSLVVHVSPDASGDWVASGEALAAAISEPLARIAQRLDLTRGEVAVLLVDDALMADLHRHYSGVSGTTDVLTFNHLDDEPAGPTSPLGPADGDTQTGEPAGRLVWGDIAVCVDEAARQAQPRGHGVEHECLLYATHGLLHLLGHDDHDPEPYRLMHELEDRLLAEVGLSPVFAAAKITTDPTGATG